MKQIAVGTCVPGHVALDWLPGLMAHDFECFALNFHMSFGGIDIVEWAPRVMGLLDGRRVSSIGFYCNALENDEHIKGLEYCIDNAHLFGTNLVTTFAGALEEESVPAAIGRFQEVFSELAKRAEDKGVRLCFENCAMGGDWRRNTCNIAFNPAAWELMFDAVPSKALGLEWEPAHQMVQLIEPLPQLKKWAGRIYHIHGKDTSIDWDVVRREGIYSATEFAVERTPGFGDTDWRDVFSILRAAGYEGDVCIEGYHDPVYSRDWEMTGQLHALQYLKWCRGGAFTPNPWDK